MKIQLVTVHGPNVLDVEDLNPYLSARVGEKCMTGEDVIKIIDELNEVERNKVIVHLQKCTKPFGLILGESYFFWVNTEDDIYDEIYKIE